MEFFLQEESSVFIDTLTKGVWWVEIVAGGSKAPVIGLLHQERRGFSFGGPPLSEEEKKLLLQAIKECLIDY